MTAPCALTHLCGIEIVDGGARFRLWEPGQSALSLVTKTGGRAGVATARQGAAFNVRRNLDGNGALVLAANLLDAPVSISSNASSTPFSTPADGTDPCTCSLPPCSVIASLSLQEPR